MTRLSEIKEAIKPGMAQPEQNSVKVISCQVIQKKLISQLDDGREVIVPISLLAKWKVLNKDVKPEQLKKYELQNEGRYIYFPEIDDILPARVISEGLFKSCWER